MEQFLIHYGPLAVFLLATLENDITFLMVGVVVNLGYMPLFPSIGAGVAGALVHDSIWFALGHHRSVWIKKSSAYQKVGTSIERLAARFGPLELFFCRFLPGTRNASLLFWGIQRMPTVRFLAIEVGALLLWGTFLTLLGYTVSDEVAAIAGKVKRIERWLGGALVITITIYFALRAFTRQKLAKHLRPKNERGDDPQ
jgi:membrane protein DedA with SNARE-associated domain